MTKFTNFDKQVVTNCGNMRAFLITQLDFHWKANVSPYETDGYFLTFSYYVTYNIKFGYGAYFYKFLY